MSEFSNYRDISSKLKKRFSLRKPNYLEAASSFKKLSNELNSFSEYSGFCLYSAAQCHHNNVVLLQEQKAKSNSGINLFLPSTSSSSNNRTQSRPGTAVQSDTFGTLQSNVTASDLGKNRILNVAQQTESQTWLDAARKLKEAGEINGATSAYWHCSQTCALPQLAMIYFEWANMLQEQKK